MRWAVAVVAALLGALLLPGFARAQEFVVFIDVRLSPSTITVEVGDSVVWFNGDADAHWIESDGDPKFDSTGSIAPNDESVPVLFNGPGTYRYFDAHNPADQDLFGTVNVVAKSGPPPPPATTTTTRPPSTTSTTAPPSSTTSTTTTSTTTTTTAPPPARPRISGSADEGQIPPASEAWRNVSGPYAPRRGDAPAPPASSPGDPVAAAPAVGTPVPGSEEASTARPKRSNAGLFIGGLLVLLAAGAALSGIGRSAIERVRGR